MPEKRLLWTRQSREGSSCPRDHHHASSVDDAILLPFMPAMHIDERVCLLRFQESSVACLRTEPLKSHVMRNFAEPTRKKLQQN